jgi:hypothetical protein
VARDPRAPGHPISLLIKVLASPGLPHLADIVSKVALEQSESKNEQ